MVFFTALLTVGAPSAIASPARTTATPQMITVTVGAPANATYDTAFSVAASSSSGLDVTFSSGGSCTNEGSRFTMRSGAGTCQVKYDQPGNATYDPAPQVVQLVQAQKADQTIDFEPLSSKRYGDPDIAVVALATSDLPVSLAARGKCTISGAILKLTGPGSCTVTATQSGDANYNAAPPASRTFAIAPGCRVPNVVGKTLGGAKSALAKARCKTGKVRQASSRKQKGTIVSQSRKAGRDLPSGTKIDLVVSRGRRP